MLVFAVKIFYGSPSVNKFDRKSYIFRKKNKDISIIEILIKVKRASLLIVDGSFKTVEAFPGTERNIFI